MDRDGRGGHCVHKYEWARVMKLNKQRLAGAVRAKRGSKTMAQIAEPLDSSASTMSRIENGKGTNNVELLLKLCNWLEISLEFFIWEEPSNQS